MEGSKRWVAQLAKIEGSKRLQWERERGDCVYYYRQRKEARVWGREEMEDEAIHLLEKERKLEQ